MTSTLVRAPAKINLGLSVGPVRYDGFHELATIYLALDLHDTVRVTPRDDDKVEVSVQADADSRIEYVNVPLGPENLAVQAVEHLRDEVGLTTGLDIAIRKVIPVAGGMAGGSSDAAAALVGTNAAFGLGLSRDQLAEIGAKVGSDVPFLLHGGIGIGTGRGEQISPVLTRGHYSFLIAVSDVGLSTPEVYAEFDRLHPDPGPPRIPAALMAALRSGDARELAEHVSNDLEVAATSLRPELDLTIQFGVDAGALAGFVSGSGPTCVFLVDDDVDVVLLTAALLEIPSCIDVIQTHGPAHGARVIG